MIYAPAHHLPLPYSLILMLYRRVSDQELALRYEVMFERETDGGKIIAILIRDLEEATERRLPVSELTTRELGHGRIAVQNLLDYHRDFLLLEDLWLIRLHDAAVAEDERYFRVLDLLNEKTPLPSTLPAESLINAPDEEPSDGTGRAAFQYLVDRLGIGIKVVSARHTRSGFAGTECYEVVLELAGRRVTTDGGLTGHHTTNGITLPAIYINESGQASFPLA